MNIRRLTILVFLLLLLETIHLFSQDEKKLEIKTILLSDISDNINEYKSRTITLRLRLKHVDKIFEKITFYDSKNHDIVFDISARQKKKRIAAEMLNLHEGMDYDVTFIVQNVSNTGELIAELKSFKPVILDVIPEISGGK